MLLRVFIEMNQHDINFSGIYAQTYDELYSSLDPRTELQQAELFCGVALSKKSAIIDVGGGTGRFSEILCKQCNFVYLVEPSPDMISIATTKLAKFDNLRIICDTAQNFKLPKRAQRAYLMFSVASYFSSPELFRRAIENIISNLDSGSVVYFDIWEFNDSTIDELNDSVKIFTQNDVEYQKITKIKRESIIEKKSGFYSVLVNIEFQNFNIGSVYQENHEIALISKKWIGDFLSQNYQIRNVRTRSNPNKKNNLEVCITLK